MVLSELSIRRPVLATVMSLMIVLIGLVSYDRLTVREYPNIDEPVVTVETTYRGASAEIVESRITTPLEESLSGIEGIEVMSSISRQEKSQITLRFVVTRDPDGAANDVRDRVARVRNLLPDEIDEPVVQKVEADAQPIIYLAFSSDRHTPLEVTDIADRLVKSRLQTLPGVANVMIYGERCGARTSRSRRGGSRAARASSMSSPRPICRRRSSSRICASARCRATSCGCAMSAAPRSPPPTSASSPATTASRRSRSASSSRRPRTPWKSARRCRRASRRSARCCRRG
jgi:hypothetical protein